MTDVHTDHLALALGELAASATHHDRDESDEPKACPVCGQMMAVLRQFDVAMDVCEAHGVWLDQGELALILERTYWHRRQIEAPPKTDPGQNMNHTRKKFTKSLSRVAGLVGM